MLWVSPVGERQRGAVEVHYSGSDRALRGGRRQRAGAYLGGLKRFGPGSEEIGIGIGVRREEEAKSSK